MSNDDDDAAAISNPFLLLLLLPMEKSLLFAVMTSSLVIRFTSSICSSLRQRLARSNCICPNWKYASEKFRRNSIELLKLSLARENRRSRSSAEEAYVIVTHRSNGLLFLSADDVILSDYDVIPC